ncbi:MAG: hypothetical protein JNL70_07060 [Saprospiraceae bacterium]|nr:hypothetical protein [Saprospiraceae bacterium]
MENTPKEDLIAKYGGKKYAPLESPTANKTAEKEDYKAMSEHARRSSRFRIVDAKGSAYGSGYAYLLGWHYTPPNLLSLFTSSHIFHFEGRGLEAIERALLDEKVRELRVYSPERHLLSEDTETILESLEVK